jgi:Family of unknown function (DUF5719)
MPDGGESSERVDGRRDRGHRGRVLRAPILAVIVAALVIGGLVDRTGTSGHAAAVPIVQPVPVAAPQAALSSSWFCAGATNSGLMPGRVDIANSGTSPAAGVVTLIPSSGASRQVSVTVAAHSLVSVGETVPGGGTWVGAIVDIDAGSVGVDQVIQSTLGVVATPCATSGSSHWYFANGFTLINAGVEISLLNPYPTDSVVDLSFTTNEGVEAPEDFQGLVVPGDGLLTVNLGTHLRRRTAIATTVSARTGSVVAWKTDWAVPPKSGEVVMGTPAANAPLADPAWPDPGLTLTLGSPSAGTSWTWPDGLTGNGINEQYLIYNPGPSTADVRLSIGLAQGTAEPFDLSVGPYEVLVVVSQQEARIPSGVPHSAVLVSVNGVPVVAERVVASGGGSEGSADWAGLGELFGGRIAATQWLVPIAVGGRGYAGSVTVYNPGLEPVKVSVAGMGHGRVTPIGGAAPVSVGPGQRAAISLNSAGSVRGSLLVDATGSVYVQTEFFRVGQQGTSLSFAVPLSP